MNRHEELQSLLDELGKELQQAKAQVGEERKNVYDLQTQLEVCYVRFYHGDKFGQSDGSKGG